MAAGRLSSVDSPNAILGVTMGQSVCSIALPAASFCRGLDTQGIITTTIKVIGFKYLATLKKGDHGAIEANI